MTKFEKDLQDSTQQQKEFVDTDQLWTNIEPHLIKKRRKKAIPFWILFGILFISAGTAYLTNISYSNSKVTSVSKTVNQVPRENENTILVSNVPAGKIENSVSDTSNTPTQYIKSLQQFLSPNITTKANLNNPYSKTNSLITVSPNNIELQSKGSFSRPSNSALRNKDTDIKINPSLTFNPNLFELENTNQETQIIDQKGNSITVNPKNNFNATHDINSLALSMNLLPNEVSLPPLESKFSHGILVEQRNNFDYYISGGVSHSPLHLTLEDSEWEQQYTNRLNAESRLMSWHIRAGIRKNLANDWSIKAGLLLTKMHSRSQTTLTTTELIQLDNVVVERIISPQGIEDVYGSVEVNQTTTKEVRRISTSTGVDLNISLLKSLHLSSFASVYFGPMLTYNLSYGQNGSIHPIQNTEYNLEQDESNWFKSNLGLSVGIETGIRYQIKNNLKIEASLLFDHKLNDFNTTNNRIGERRHTLHLGIGMSQSF